MVCAVEGALETLREEITKLLTPSAKHRNQLFPLVWQVNPLHAVHAVEPEKIGGNTCTYALQLGAQTIYDSHHGMNGTWSLELRWTAHCKHNIIQLDILQLVLEGMKVVLKY